MPWYLTNSLCADDYAKVEKHLTTCPSCKNALKKIKGLSEDFQHMEKEESSQHINSALLTIYSENKKELTKNDIQAIEKHLSVCAECKNEIQILTTVNRSLEEQPDESLISGLLNSISSFLSRWLLKPAFAYILVLLLLYPAWMGIFSNRVKIEQVASPVNIKDHFVLEQANQRGHADISNLILLDNTKGIFTISFHLPAFISKNLKYIAEIANEENKIVWQTSNLQFIDEYGSVLLLFDKSYFRTGTYTLIIDQENKDTSKKTVEYTYAFKVQLNE